MAKKLSGSNEILIRQGEQLTVSINPTDEKGNALTLGTVASLTMKAYKYLDDTEETIDVTGSIAQDDQSISVTIEAADVASVTPGTYFYILKGNNDSVATVFARDNFTVVRSF